MKPITVSISYGNLIPNIPAEKNMMKKFLTPKELAYAKKIANTFIRKTLISKSFLENVSSSEDTVVTRIFTVKNENAVKDVNKVKTSYILKYAALTIFGHLFTHDLCPENLDILLGFKCTNEIPSDSDIQKFDGDPVNIFIISLASKID